MFLAMLTATRTIKRKTTACTLRICIVGIDRNVQRHRAFSLWQHGFLQVSCRHMMSLVESKTLKDFPYCPMFCSLLTDYCNSTLFSVALQTHKLRIQSAELSCMRRPATAGVLARSTSVETIALAVGFPADWFNWQLWHTRYMQSNSQAEYPRQLISSQHSAWLIYVTTLILRPYSSSTSGSTYSKWIWQSYFQLGCTAARPLATS